MYYGQNRGISLFVIAILISRNISINSRFPPLYPWPRLEATFCTPSKTGPNYIDYVLSIAILDLLWFGMDCLKFEVHHHYISNRLNAREIKKLYLARIYMAKIYRQLPGHQQTGKMCQLTQSQWHICWYLLNSFCE